MTKDQEHDDDWYRRRFEADKGRMIEEFGSCDAADAIERNMLSAPMPNPDGTPIQANPLPVEHFLGVERRSAESFAPIEQRLLPAAKVECGPDGQLGPIRYRADLAQGDEVPYDDQID